MAFSPLSAVQGCTCFAAAAAFVVGSDGPSPCSLDASVASFVTLAFTPLCAVQGCASALLQPLSSSSALMGRRRARLRRASPVSLRWRFYRCARCRAASALLQPLPSSSALMGRRRARSTRASPASIRWRFYRCARCRAVQVLCCSRCLRRRLWCGPSPCSLDASVASFATLGFLPLCAVQGRMCFAAAAAFVLGSRPLPCSLA